MHWKVLSTEYLVKHPPYFIARKDVCQREDGSVIPSYYVVELPPSVIVVPLLPGNQVMMVKQYRHPVGEISLEFPGGFIDEGETPLEAARRETLEETGHSFANYIYLGRIAANPGVLNNFTHFFLATDMTGRQDQQLEHNEEIRMEFYTVPQVAALLRENKIIQALHATACYYALAHLGQLNSQPG